MDDRVRNAVYIIKHQEKYAADLEQALQVAGVGWYNLKHLAILTLFLIAFAVEQNSYSFVLPAAACDLEMSSSTRGYIVSLSYSAFFLTSYPLGYLVDTQGRKKTLIYSSLTAGIFSIMSGLMPDVTSFVVCKCVLSLCLPCSAAVPYTFVEEIMPAQHRDMMLFWINGLQMFGSLLVPLLAWAILPLNISISFGAYVFRPWRLLVIVYASSFIIAAILLAFYPESPKYLVSQGKSEEALQVLKMMYAGNKGKRKEFPIDRLIVPPVDREKGSFWISLREQTAPVLKWMYLKWLLLMGFLLYCTFSIFNGLYMWAPDISNRVLGESSQGKTACQVISEQLHQNSTAGAVCYDNINERTLFINTVAQAGCTVAILLISSTVKFVGKKSILIIVFFVTGTFCILINFITNELVSAYLLLTLPVVILTLGSVNAYVIEIIPIHLRGVALTVCMMLGTIGAISSSSIAGLLINEQCETMFYLFGGLVFISGALSFILPNKIVHENVVN